MLLTLFDIYHNLLKVFVCAAVAYHQFIFAGNNTHGIGVYVPALKTATGQVDAEGLGLAASQLHLLISPEGLLRTFFVGDVADIHLYGLSAFSLPTILNAHLYLIIFIGGFAKVEGRVTQAVAEGEKRLTCKIAVGAVLHRVVEEVGQIVGTLIESDG